MAKVLAALLTIFLVVSLACSPKEPTPNANEVRSSATQNAADSGGEEKLSLSESERKKICEEIFRTWKQVNLEANAKYPMVAQEKRSSPAEMIERGRKRAEYIGEVMEKAMTQLANEYHLSKTQLMKIEEEGIDKDWIKLPARPPEYR